VASESARAVEDLGPRLDRGETDGSLRLETRALLGEGRGVEQPVALVEELVPAAFHLGQVRVHTGILSEVAYVPFASGLLSRIPLTAVAISSASSTSAMTPIWSSQTSSSIWLRNSSSRA